MLECIRLTIENDRKIDACDGHRDCNNECNDGRLAYFLNTAPNLQHLFVRKRGQWPMCLRAVVGDYAWTHLATISLSYFSCTAKRLANFLDRHSSTVKQLMLDSPVIKHGRWKTCFVLIAGTFAQLEQVHLRGRFQGPSSDDLIRFSTPDETETSLARKVQNYILDGGDDVPRFFGETEESETEDEDD